MRAARRSMPSRRSSRVWSKSRMRGRNWPRCSRAPARASRWSISAPAPAAAMENRGQIYATDTDKRRLAPIHARLERAGVRNVQVRAPRARPHADARADAHDRAPGAWADAHARADALPDQHAHADLVL